MDARGAELDVEEWTNHGCSGSRDCMFAGRIAPVTMLDCVGGRDRQEKSEEIVNVEKFHCKYWSSAEMESEETPGKSRAEIEDPFITIFKRSPGTVQWT